MLNEIKILVHYLIYRSRLLKGRSPPVSLHERYRQPLPLETKRRFGEGYLATPMLVVDTISYGTEGTNRGEANEVVHGLGGQRARKQKMGGLSLGEARSLISLPSLVSMSSCLPSCISASFFSSVLSSIQTCSHSLHLSPSFTCPSLELERSPTDTHRLLTVSARTV